MNIDIREYLRSSPISAHPITYSKADNDIFLLFDNDKNVRGYNAITQKELFQTYLYKSILGQLVEYIDGKPRIAEWKDGEELSADQFTNYVRRKAFQNYRESFDEYKKAKEDEIKGIESKLDDQIKTLKRKGKLTYDYAVEVQTKSNCKLYSNWENMIGNLWCTIQGSNGGNGESSEDGQDFVDNIPSTVSHNHLSTAEEYTLSQGLATNKFGGNTLGTFTIGNYVLVASDKTFGETDDTILKMIEHQADDSFPLTYPLFGENMMDFRTPARGHDNIPPSLNVYIKYKKPSNKERGVLNFSSKQMLLSRGSSSEDEEESDNDSSSSSSESSLQQKSDDNIMAVSYESNMVNELPEYYTSDYSKSDVLLRLRIQENDILFRKQTLETLENIFVDKSKKDLSTEEKTVDELLRVHLDKLLVPLNEFTAWYSSIENRIQEILKKQEYIKELMKSVMPLNYIGRVIISTTDDIELKVIRKYGGKHWRRIENFLRGVEKKDEIGLKLGEEYVCLRESNVPIHTHNQLVNREGRTKDQEWMVRDRGGQVETRILDYKEDSEEEDVTMIESNNVKTAKLNYSIGELDYDYEDKTITIPHDNMPPYTQVYIWECTELTEEEEELLKED